MSDATKTKKNRNRKDELVGVRLLPSQIQHLREKAQEREMTLSDYVRDVLGFPARSIRPDACTLEGVQS